MFKNLVVFKAVKVKLDKMLSHHVLGHHVKFGNCTVAGLGIHK